MIIKVTELANEELNQLDPSVRGDVISTIRECLPASIANDPRLALEELGAEVRIHSIESHDLLVLYRMVDAGDDGKDEAVVLTVIGRNELPALADDGAGEPAARRYLTTKSVPSSARIGHELVSKIREAGV